MPGAVAAILLLALHIWRRKRKGLRRDKIKEHREQSDHSELYLQRKAELEAEESNKYELSGEPRKTELQRENGICEVPTGRDGDIVASTKTTQELEVEEHPQELGSAEGQEDTKLLVSGKTGEKAQ